jgi:hypothetical protein
MYPVTFNAAMVLTGSIGAFHAFGRGSNPLSRSNKRNLNGGFM